MKQRRISKGRGTYTGNKVAQEAGRTPGVLGQESQGQHFREVASNRLECCGAKPHRSKRTHEFQQHGDQG